MKRQNRKGFTIVELVIVIAVIAILAAVLIPTFAGLVAKANLASDQQAVNQMNKAVAMTGEDIADIESLVNALYEAGYNAKGKLAPVSRDHKFYWDKENKTIILVKEAAGEDAVVVFPENATYENNAERFYDLAESYKLIVVTTDDVATLTQALKNGVENIVLSNDVAVTDAIAIPENANVTIDLNGKTFDASTNEARPFMLNDGATLKIVANNGTIKCGDFGLVDMIAGSDVNVELDGGTYLANTDNGAFIRLRGAGAVNVTLKNVTYTDESNDGYLMGISGYSGNANIAINGGSYEAAYGFQMRGEATVSNAKIVTDGFAIHITGNAVVDNCEITTGNADRTNGNEPAAAVAVDNNYTATVTNCTIITEASAFDVYTSGGTINATGCTITGNKYADRSNDMYKGTTATITIDGEVVYTASK